MTENSHSWAVKLQTGLMQSIFKWKQRFDSFNHPKSPLVMLGHTLSHPILIFCLTFPSFHPYFIYCTRIPNTSVPLISLSSENLTCTETYCNCIEFFISNFEYVFFVNFHSIYIVLFSELNRYCTKKNILMYFCCCISNMSVPISIQTSIRLFFFVSSVWSDGELSK